MSAIPERLTAALADRYRIERELGEGGMATVYLAEDLKHKRRVALKVLKPELAAVLGGERFVQEITTTAALQHPHILPLFDSGTADGFLFYVMPFIDGETLRGKLDRETQLSVDEAVKITTDVADALHYAHTQGVIHRDIKPENILLANGRPMVADFGIALALSAAAGGRMTETGLSLGTPHYMSPEQATAEKEISARSDVYSLASVLYEMLAGNPPHTGASAQQIIMKIIAEPVAMVTTLRKSVPANVSAALVKGLEKLPADRFQSAAAFSDALRNPHFTVASVTNAHNAHSRGTSSRAFIGAVAAAVVFAAVAAWGWLRPTPTPEVSRFSVSLPDSLSVAWQGSMDRRLAISRDGRTLAFIGPGLSLGSTRLWIRKLSDLHATPIPGTEGAASPAFSPDGQRIAFVAGSPRSLRTISISGGSSTLLTDSLVDDGGVSWASDGYVYYDGHLEGDGLARVKETGGLPEIVSRPDETKGESYHNDPAALPNAKGVLFAQNSSGRWDIGVVDLKTGQHKILAPGMHPNFAASGHLLHVSENGVLMATPFDQDRMELTGSSVPVAEGVAATTNGRSDVAISANGLLVYAAGTGATANRELVWVNREGGVTRVDSQWSGRITRRATLSPDGKSAALTILNAAGTQIWIKQLDRGPASKLADMGIHPVWSPDGKDIVFRTGNGKFARGPADGSVLPQTFDGGKPDFTYPEFSPDGTWLLFVSNGELFARRTDGDTTVHALAKGAVNVVRVAVSPDSRWLAYTSHESGRSEVYVRPFPETSTAKRQVSVNGGFAPRWSRDGRELVFVDGQARMIAVPVTASPTFAAGIPTVLFSGDPFTPNLWPFDVSVDGTRFLMSRAITPAGAGDNELIVVQNFFEELRAKVKR